MLKNIYIFDEIFVHSLSFLCVSKNPLAFYYAKVMGVCLDEELQGIWKFLVMPHWFLLTILIDMQCM